VNLIAAAFGDNVHDAAALIAILRVDVVGKHAEFGDGIQIGNTSKQPLHRPFAVGIAPGLRLRAAIVGRPDKYLSTIGEHHFPSRSHERTISGSVSNHRHSIADF
jgi:hypothetical protein